MAKEPDDIQPSITATRHEMAETRTALTEKLEGLEERVRDSVAGAKSTAEDMTENVKRTVDETASAVKETVGEARATVAGMVEHVQDTMEDTVSRVKQSFDVHAQVDRHPWVMLGGSVLAGYLLGGLDARSTVRPYRADRAWAEAQVGRGGYFTATATPDAEHPPTPASQSRTRTSRLWQNTLGQFKEEFDLLTGAVIVALMHNVGDMAKQSLPGIAPQLEKALESAAAKLGGHVGPEGAQEEQRAPDQGHERRD